MKAYKLGAVQAAIRGNKHLGSLLNQFEPELKTYLSGLVTPLSVFQKTALNDFIKLLKSGLNISALSEAFNVIHVLANETQEAALRNLVKREHDAEAKGTVAPVFAANEGFTGNGVSGYLDWNWNGRTAGHADPFLLNSASFGIYFKTTTDHTDYEVHGVMATVDENNYTNKRIQISRPNNKENIYSVALNSNVDTLLSTEKIGGLYIASRTASNVQKLYVNKVLKINGPQTSTDIPNQNMISLANQRNPIKYFENDQISFQFLGRGFTQSEVDIITDAFDAYMATVFFSL